MKGYYLFAPVEPECVGSESGVEKKVRAQCAAINKYFDCKLIILNPVFYSGTIAEKIIRRFPFTPGWRKWKYNGEFDDADFLYIRQVYHDASFFRYLKEIKRKNKNLKIVYEVPTYPYDKQKKITISSLPFIIKERIERRRCAKYFDKIVTFYGQETIWGVPCIAIKNGFDFSSVQLVEKDKTDIINILSVSATAFWHGYDRLINGLFEYYKNGGTADIKYHFVGDILPEYKEMVESLNLKDRVKFYGRLGGGELVKVYNQCLLAVNVLGGYKGTVPVSSSLKSREYAAYGIPFISSLPVDFLPENYKYQLIVPHNDSPVDMKSVVDFYHSIYDAEAPNIVASNFRNFSENKCDMSVTMKPVIDWLNNVL